MKYLVLVLLVPLLLSACAHRAPATQVAPFALQNNQSAVSLVNELRLQDVQVIHLGQTWRLVLDSNQFFLRHTTQLKNKYVTRMAPIANLIKTLHPTGPIVVTGYTDNIGAPTQQILHAKQYANTVAAYLWAQGIPYHQLLIRGAGNKNRVATNRTSQGKAYNRRVEITFNE